MSKQAIIDALKLVLITLVAGVCLALVYQITKGPIEVATQKEKAESYRAVYADAVMVEPMDYSYQGSATLNEICIAKNANGEEIGFVMSITSHTAFHGDLSLSMGVDLQGKITGVLVTESTETPGYGAKCQEEEWISQFKGIQDDKLELGEIDGISGATKTTKSVLEAINAGLEIAGDVGNLPASGNGGGATDADSSATNETETDADSSATNETETDADSSATN